MSDTETGHARYVGTDRNGTARTGCTEDAAQLAERCYDRGWRWLRITDGLTGDEVGGIGLSHDHPRRRIWWAATNVPLSTLRPANVLTSEPLIEPPPLPAPTRRSALKAKRLRDGHARPS